MNAVASERPEVLAAQRTGAEEAQLHRCTSQDVGGFVHCLCGWVGTGHLAHAASYIAAGAAWAVLTYRDQDEDSTRINDP